MKVAAVEPTAARRVKVGRPREQRSGGSAGTRRGGRESGRTEKARGFGTVDDVGRGWRRKGDRNDDQYFATPRATTYPAAGAKH